MQVFAFLSLLAFAAVDVRPPTAEAVEEQVLQQRRALRSGRVELDSTVWDFPAGVKTLTLRANITTWFDGDKIRRDIRRPYRNKPQNMNGVTYRDISCLANGSHIWWSDQKLPGGGTLAIDLHTDVKQMRILPRQRQIPHPRLVGMFPVDCLNLAHFQLESVIGRPDRQAPTMQRTTWNGMRCWKIEYVRKDGCKLEEVFAIDRGLTPVRLRCECQSGGSVSVDTLECEAVRAENSEVWFPSRCHYTHTRGGSLEREELLTVKIKDVNKPMPDRVFTPQAMGIPPGTQVSCFPPDPRGQLVWDGKDFVPMDIQQQARETKLSGRNVLLFASCALGLFAIAVLLQYMRTRMRIKHP